MRSCLLVSASLRIVEVDYRPTVVQSNVIVRMCVLFSEDEAVTAAAVSAPETEEKGVVKGAQDDARPKAKPKGTFTSLLTKQSMHRKGSSGKGPAVKGRAPFIHPCAHRMQRHHLPWTVLVVDY